MSKFFLVKTEFLVHQCDYLYHSWRNMVTVIIWKFMEIFREIRFETTELLIKFKYIWKLRIRAHKYKTMPQNFQVQVFKEVKIYFWASNNSLSNDSRKNKNFIRHSIKKFGLFETIQKKLSLPSTFKGPM